MWRELKRPNSALQPILSFLSILLCSGRKSHQASWFKAACWLHSWYCVFRPFCVSPYAMQLPLPTCPSPSLEAAHGGLFVLPSGVSQGYAFVFLSCLVQECYLYGGLICFNTSLPLQDLHSIVFLPRSTLVPSLRNLLFIFVLGCVLGLHTTGQEMPHSFSSLNQV